MATGDPQCGKCGRYNCFGGCNAMGWYDGRGDEVSMRPIPYDPHRHRPPKFEKLADPEDDQSDEPMTHEDLVVALTSYMGDAVFARRFADCITMLRRKNADYTAGNAADDRIYNFRRAGEEVGLPMKQIWYVYAWKHWTAIRKFVRDSHVESEPIDGRINDMINYLVLLGAIKDDEGDKADG